MCNRNDIYEISKQNILTFIGLSKKFDNLKKLKSNLLILNKLFKFKFHFYKFGFKFYLYILYFKYIYIL